MTEVSFKLGQTLWRKLFPDELEEADSQLILVVYDYLKLAKWNRAQMLGEFAIGLPKFATDRDRRICIINLAIAYKFGGRETDALNLLRSEDWSGTANEFRIAETVLDGKYDEAANVMERNGKHGEFLKEESYHIWPLFREFRETEQFHKAYEKVYGYLFAVELQRRVEAAEVSANKELKKQELASEELPVESSDQNK